MDKKILAIDAGTTGVTLLLFASNGELLRRASSEFTQHYPRPGWVEHDPEEIWQVTRRLIHDILPGEERRGLAGIGITNQRETVVAWDAETRRPYHKAIVWQCRRTAERCRELAPKAPLFRERTGLMLDAYFSGTKLAWLLENVEEAREGAEAGRARFGTIDTWLIDRLSNGALHVTDFTNASRTLMYDIHERAWSDELLEALGGIPRGMLPEVKDSSAIYGVTSREAIGVEVPIAAAVGDQQAALFGHACVEEGSSKNTYGTGCFALINAGPERVQPKEGLLLTLACDARGRPTYAHEGSVFIAGALIQWLRDELKIIRAASETEALARSIEDSKGVMVVPAFAGLGAPYWDAEARGAILGLTRGAGRAEIARAALESIAFQTRDLIEALGGGLSSLQVDGGATANNFLMQFQADILGVPVVRPSNLDTTAQGAAFLAGLATGVWKDIDAIRRFRSVDRVFEPDFTEAQRDEAYGRWQAAVRRVRTDG